MCKAVEEIAAVSCLSVDEVKELIAVDYAPGYDSHQVYEALQKPGILCISV